MGCVIKKRVTKSNSCTMLEEKKDLTPGWDFANNRDNLFQINPTAKSLYNSGLKEIKPGCD